jgi:hypothetical protein
MTTALGPIAAQKARNAALMAQAESLVSSSQPAGRALPVILLPANTRNTTELPLESREAFLASVRLAIDLAFAQPLRDNASPMSAEADGARQDAGEVSLYGAVQGGALTDALIGASCGTCRGECCTAGGTHAFLKVDSLVRVRAQLAAADAAGPRAARMRADGADGALTADGLEALYASHLPARHYRGSCVYHTTAGCNLPRSLRANLCNRYVCGGLTQLGRALAATGSTEAFVAAADSAHLRRIALVSEQGGQRIAIAAE